MSGMGVSLGMLTKEIQYRIYAGTSKDDYTGWTRTEVPENEKDVEFWTLDLGDGYVLDRVTKQSRGLFGKKTIKINSIRRFINHIHIII